MLLVVRIFMGLTAPVSGGLLATFLAVEDTRPTGSWVIPTLIAVFVLSGLLSLVWLWPKGIGPSGTGDQTTVTSSNQSGSSITAGGDVDTGHGAFRGNVIQHSNIHVSPPPPRKLGSPFDRAVADAETELDSIASQLRHAETHGVYRYGFLLPAVYFQRVSHELADRQMWASRKIVSDAYNNCDGLTNKVQPREWDGSPIPDRQAATVIEQDQLPDVIASVDAALDELRQIQGQKPSGATREAGSAPIVEFRDPTVSDGKTFQGFFTGSWDGYVVVLHVANEGSEPATAVWATARVTSLDGTTVFQEAPARWPNETTPRHITIPANSQPNAIDSIVQATDEYEKCWLVTDEGLRHEGVRQEQWAVPAADFIVEMTVRGENVPVHTQRVRVRLGFPKPMIEVLEG